jgi:hypothetical protein
MSLGAAQRDALLASAGFMPEQVENLIAAEPIVGEVLGMLQDLSVPDDVREDLRTSVEMAVRQAQRAIPTLSTSGSTRTVAAAY